MREAYLLWSHQANGIDGVCEAILRGVKRICMTSPTGSGKTDMVQHIIQWVLSRGNEVSLYSNRVMLAEQHSESMVGAGLYHGVRARWSEQDHDYAFQVCSIQSEHSRVTKRKLWLPHACNPGDLAIFDEGHLHTGETARIIRQRHLDGGAVTLDITATPIDMGEVCDELIVAGTTRQCIEVGALVPAHHFGPDEPDLKSLKVREGEDLTESQQRKAMKTPTLWGRVWEWFNKLNPDRKPTILFAPGVPESIWFAEQFESKGVRAAHIDGSDVWVDGELHKTTSEIRKQILADSKAGRIGIITNRFVLREGIDAPWLEHGILATVFGSLKTALQSGGRLLRAYDGKTHATIQDHGGNWWKHGSLNSDREWSLEYTDAIVYGLRAERLRNKKDREPWRCPQCGKINNAARCLCGYEAKSGKKSRPVVTSDGSLKEMTGDVFNPRRISRSPEGPQVWEKMYHRSRTERGARTFRAAAALFAMENNFGWPDPSWPYMPTSELDWFRNVADVPRDRLT